MRQKKYRLIRKFYTYYPEINKSQCRMCPTLLSGDYLGSLKSHLNTFHKEAYVAQMSEETEDIEEEIGTPKKMKRIQIQMDKDVITDSCVNLVTKESRPFTLLDSEAFRAIVEPIFKGLSITAITSRNIADIVAAKASKIRQQIRDLCRGKVISVKIDMATGLNRSVIVVNIQFIRSKRIIVKTLATIELREQHTAEILEKEILGVLQRYDINANQIYNVTTDHGRNLIKRADLLREDSGFHFDILHDQNENEIENKTFIRLLSSKRFTLAGNEAVRCPAYILQLAVNDVLRKDEDARRVITQARNICETLRTLPNTPVPNMEFIIPINDVPRQWSSSITMLEILMRYKNFCLQMQHVYPKLRMSVEDWKVAHRIIATFLPIKEMTVKLQNDQLLLADFWKHLIILKLIIEKQEAPLAKKLELEIKKRDAELLNVTATTAVLLDPRISMCLHKEQKNIAKDHFKKVMSQILQAKKDVKDLEEISAYLPVCVEYDIPTPSTATSAFPPLHAPAPTSGTQSVSNPESTHATSLPVPSTGEQLLEKFLQFMKHSEGDVEEAEYDPELGAALKQIDEYRPKSIPAGSNLLDYWEEKKYALLYLYKVAKVIHAVPVTQVSVKRAFLTLNFMLNDNRYNLSPADLENILLVKLN